MMRRTLIAVALLTLLLAVACSKGNAEESSAAAPAAEQAEKAAPEKALVVEIGETAAAAEKAASHDLTFESLKGGTTEYAVASASGANYKVRLSAEEIQELLTGTAVVVTTAEGSMTVRISVTDSADKKSGW